MGGFFMKLSFTTLGCPKWSWKQIVENAAAYGYKGIELRGVEGELYLPKVSYFSDLNLKDTLNYLKEKNIEIVCLGSSVNFHDPENFEKNLNEARDYIELAEKMGVKYIRVFGDRITDLSKREEILGSIAKGLEQVYKMCEGKDVIPLLEVHGSINNIQVFKDLFKRFTHPNFSVIWDIMHSHVSPDDTDLEFFGFIRPYIKHVHVKDCYWDEAQGKWMLCNIGEGELPIPMFCNLLAATNYDGYLSLEWEKGWHPYLAEPEEVFPHYVKYMNKIFPFKR